MFFIFIFIFIIYKIQDMSTAKINELLKECDHHDKDNRFMAAMDLCQEMIKLSEAGKIDEALEKKICS